MYYYKEVQGDQGMILTGPEIKRQIELGNIVIEPFDPKRLNPNSYDLSLHNQLMVYTDRVIDSKSYNNTKTITIPSQGYTLEPNILYLGRTVEHTVTRKHVPCIEGKSSIGRLGIDIHKTAGFGDVNFEGYWVLELCVVQPVTIYPFMKICQIVYHEVVGEILYYTGKYQSQKDIVPSLMWQDETMK